MIALSTLLAPLTQPTIRTSLVNRLTSFGIPAANWRPGGVSSTTLTAVSYVFAGFASLLTSALNGGFLPTASGAWLVALAYYVYGVQAQQPTFGTGTLTLTNTGGGNWTFAPGAAVFQCSVAGSTNTFVNTAPIALGPGTPGSPTTQTFAIQAQALGSIGGAPAGTITIVVTRMPSVAASNANAVLGLDADTDANLRIKCLAAIAARSYKGPTGAYYAAIYGYGNVAGATNSVSGLPVNVNRVQVYTDPDTGNITVYIASPGGPADPNDVTGVQTAIDNVARPYGITATAVSAAVEDFSATITIWSTSQGAAAAAAIQALGFAAITAANAQYPIGGRVKTGSQGYLFASYITAAVGAVDSTIYAVDLSSWSALPLNPGQVASVISSITVRQVPA